MKKLKKLFICIMTMLLSVSILAFAACSGNGNDKDKNTGNGGTVNIVVQGKKHITLDKTTAILIKNQTLQLSATLPEGVEGDITWYSYDENIATVDNGIVTGTGVGKTTILAVCGEYSANCTINVIMPPVHADTLVIEFNQQKIVLDADLDQEFQLDADVYFNGELVEAEIEWVGSNDNAFIVSKNGLVKAVSNIPGMHTVTAKVEYEGQIQTTNLEVYTETFSRVIPASDTIVVYPGEEATKVGVELYIGAEKTNDLSNLTYKTSNSKIATVSADGYITANGTGYTTLTISHGSVSTDVLIIVGEINYVRTAEEFMEIDGAPTNSKFVLRNNIDLGDYLYNNNAVNSEYLIETLNAIVDGNNFIVTGIQRFYNDNDKGFKGIFNKINSTGLIENITIQATLNTKYASTLIASEFSGVIEDSAFFITNVSEAGDTFGTLLFGNANGVIKNTRFDTSVNGASFSALALKGLNTFDTVYVTGTKPAFGSYLNGEGTSANINFSNCIYARTKDSIAYTFNGTGVTQGIVGQFTQDVIAVNAPSITVSSYEDVLVGAQVNIVAPQVSDGATSSYRVIDSLGYDVTKNMVKGDVFVPQYKGQYTIVSKATLDGITSIAVSYVNVGKLPIVMLNPANDKLGVSLKVGESFDLEIKDANPNDFYFYTTDEATVSVDAQGKITAKGIGFALVKIVSKDTPDYVNVIVEVTLKDISSYVQDARNIVIEAGGNYNLADAGYVTSKYKYEVTSGLAVSVDQNGIITSNFVGDSEITLTAVGSNAKTVIKVKVVTKYVEISTLEQLIAIDGVKNAYFKLVNDITIDASAELAVDGNGKPIYYSQADFEAGLCDEAQIRIEGAVFTRADYEKGICTEAQIDSARNGQQKRNLVNLKAKRFHPLTYPNQIHFHVIEKLDSVFDGNGHKITLNYNVTSADIMDGLFNEVYENAEVKNLIYEFNGDYRKCENTSYSSTFTMNLSGLIRDSYFKSTSYTTQSTDQEGVIGIMKNYRDTVFTAKLFNNIFDIEIYEKTKDGGARLTGNGYAVRIGSRRPSAEDNIVIKNGKDMKFFGSAATGSAVETTTAYIYRSLYNFVNGIGGSMHNTKNFVSPVADGAVVYANWNDHWSISKDSIYLCGRKVVDVEYEAIDDDETLGLSISGEKLYWTTASACDVYVNDKLAASGITGSFNIAEYVLSEYEPKTADYGIIVRSGSVSEAIVFSVIGLDNSNFVSTLKSSYTIKEKITEPGTSNDTVDPDAPNGVYFVLTEDIKLTSGAYTYYDGVARSTKAEFDAQVALGNVMYARTYNILTMFGTFVDTLDGLGHSISVDMGPRENWDHNVKSATAYYALGGMFKNISGTIKNLSYYYYEDAADKAYVSSEAFFSRGLTTGGVIENVYINSYTTALADGREQYPLGGITYKGTVKNCVFDTKVLDGTELIDKGLIVAKITNHPAMGYASLIDNIVISATESRVNVEVGGEVTNQATGALNYASYKAMMKANNWLDNDDAWSTAYDEFTLVGRLLVTELKVPVRISYAGGLITVKGGSLGESYDIMQLSGSSWKKLASVRPGESIGIEYLELLEGARVYDVKVVGEGVESAIVKIGVYGLTNNNFVSTFKSSYTLGAAQSGNVSHADPSSASGTTFVLMEDIVLSSGAYFYIDGIRRDTQAEFNTAKDQGKVVQVKTYNVFTMFGTFVDTLDGLGHSITVDMGNVVNNSFGYGLTFNGYNLGGMFREVRGTIKNLRYFYIEDGAGRVNMSGTFPSYFARVITTGGVLENCYLSSMTTAYNDGHVIDAFSVISYRAVIKNSIFDAKVLTNGGTVVTQLGDVSNKIYSHGGSGRPTITDVIVIQETQSSTDLVYDNLEKGETLTGIPTYKTMPEAIAADNWLDSSSEWTITDGELSLLGGTVYEKPAPKITYTDASIAVYDGIEGVTYDVMQLKAGLWTKVATAKLGDKLSISEFDLVAGETTYKVKLESEAKESNVVEFTVFGLDNTNFLSVLQARTIAGKAGTWGTNYTLPTQPAVPINYVLTENIELDITAFDNFAYIWRKAAVLGLFWDTLDGLGYSITLDMGKRADWGVNRAYAGLFAQVNGTIKNLSYYYFADAADKSWNMTNDPLDDGYFAISMGLQGSVRARLENCYISGLYTAYNNGHQAVPIGALYRGVDIVNCVFATQVKQADSTTPYLPLVANKVSRNSTSFQPLASDNIVLGANSAIVADVLGSDAKTDTGVDIVLAQGYETFDALISADNWLDTSSVWTVTANSISLIGKVVYEKN